MITFFTTPDKSFSSFYLYDENAKKLVRIRLELGRTDGSGKTKAMFYKNRVVGCTGKSITPGQITSKDKLYNITPGLFEYDFEENNPSKYHHGNVVSFTDANLPKTITGYTLLSIAEKVMKTEKEIEFTNRDASVDQLVNRINEIQRLCE
jgi:hypothetical protein